MAREQVVRCDVCNKTGAELWTLTHEDKTWAIDLCKTHSKPLAELTGAGRETGALMTAKSSSIRAYDRALRSGG